MYYGKSKFKYRNKPTEVDGIRFASKAEARRWGELKLMEAAGMISHLTRQPKYAIQQKMQRPGAPAIRAIYYLGDFEYHEDGKVVCEDVKGGPLTQVFQLKQKMFKAVFPDIDLRIVRMK
jgi:hypothetical protein